MTHRSIQTVRLMLISAALAASVGQPAHAESACKGLDQTACAAKDECSWMNGYTRKDGVQVTGHCRLSAKKKAMAPDAKPVEPSRTSEPAPTVSAPNPTSTTPAATTTPPASVAPANPMTPPTTAAPSAKMESGQSTEVKKTP